MRSFQAVSPWSFRWIWVSERRNSGFLPSSPSKRWNSDSVSSDFLITTDTFFQSLFCVISAIPTHCSQFSPFPPGSHLSSSLGASLASLLSASKIRIKSWSLTQVFLSISFIGFTGSCVITHLTKQLNPCPCFPCIRSFLSFGSTSLNPICWICSDS